MPVVETGIAEEGDDSLAAAASKSAELGLAEEGDTAAPIRAILGSDSCCSIGEPMTPIF